MNLLDKIILQNIPLALIALSIYSFLLAFICYYVYLHMTLETSYEPGSVIFSEAYEVTEDNENFFWDASNCTFNRGFDSPTKKLHLNGRDIPAQSPGVEIELTEHRLTGTLELLPNEEIYIGFNEWGQMIEMHIPKVDVCPNCGSKNLNRFIGSEGKLHTTCNTCNAVWTR